tara:strand:- start:3240 stop:3941 length:702 start_codon:yes stop_codon:yes gene_type:complete
MHYTQLVIIILIVILSGYFIGLNIVNIVDKRLTDISINIPKSNLVVKFSNLKEEIEKFENINKNGVTENDVTENAVTENFVDSNDFQFIGMNKKEQPCCFKNHLHEDCNHGQENYGDPYIMSPVDKNAFKYNFDSTKSTLQDYVNWLYLFTNDPYELPYNHRKNLISIQSNEKISNIPKLDYKLNSMDFFTKLYNSGNSSFENKSKLEGYNFVNYSSNGLSNINNPSSIGARN